MKIFIGLLIVVSQYSMASSLNSYIGNYRLVQNESRNCPSSVSVVLGRIDVPVIDLLIINPISSGFEVPRHPSFGYPTSQRGNVFTISYQPEIEYDGPACTETADFSKSKSLHFVKTCDDKSSLNCVFVR
jgi:hypothetical protein